MTCVVAIRNKNGVLMGADSCAAGGHHASVVRTPKVAKVGEYLIGYTTSFRMGQILHHAMSTKKVNAKDDLFYHLVNVLIPEIRGALKAGGWIGSENGKEEGGSFLLAHEQRLFVVQSDFSVLEHEDDFLAIGCGEEWAIGALFALKTDSKKTDLQKLTMALEAATRFSGYVLPPYRFVQNY